MAQKPNACPICDTPLKEAYHQQRMEDKLLEFFNCETCGSQFSRVFRFSHFEVEEEDEGDL
jgi:hypothetical protein